MDKKKISVIIPTYNRAYIIGETLNSILSQTYPYWECIIVDDGSTDNTKELIEDEFVKNDNRFFYYKRPKSLKKGPNSCRNFGLTKATGEYIQWFDSDDIMLVNNFDEKIKRLKKNTDVIVSKLGFYKGGEVIGESKIESSLNSNIFFEDYYIGDVAFYVSGPLWKKSFLDRTKQIFDEDLRNLDDWDYNIRLLIIYNPKKIILNQVTILYRESEDSLLKEIEKCNPAEIKSEIEARFKILNLYNKRNKIKSATILTFLQKRFLQLYRISLVHREFELAKHCYLAISKVEKNILKKIKYNVAYYTFKFYNKGYQLLK